MKNFITKIKFFVSSIFKVRKNDKISWEFRVFLPNLIFPNNNICTDKFSFKQLLYIYMLCIILLVFNWQFLYLPLRISFTFLNIFFTPGAFDRICLELLNNFINNSVWENLLVFHLSIQCVLTVCIWGTAALSYSTLY